MAVLRYWQYRYGAELRAMSYDEIELAVARPPRTFAAALQVAREQYAYASDIVDQGRHPTVGTLASALIEVDRWYFWWD